MHPSVIVNFVIAVSVAGSVGSYFRHHSPRVMLRYFTTLSNLFCALSALGVIAGRAGGGLPMGVSVFKYAGTVSVTVTFLTVIFFLAPSIGSLAALLKGPDLFLHLICPVLALISYFAWDRQRMPAQAVAAGILPVLLYGLLYLRQVVLRPEGEGWEDFYGFNKGGHWKISFAAMIAASAVISLVLWAL